MSLEDHIRKQARGVSESNARSIFYKVLELAPHLNGYKELPELISQVSTNTFQDGYCQALADIQTGRLNYLVTASEKGFLHWKWTLKEECGGIMVAKTLLTCRKCKRKCDLNTIRFPDDDGYKNQIKCPFGFMENENSLAEWV